MVLISAPILARTDEARVSVASGYVTLHDLATSLTDQGVPTFVDESVAGRIYGVRLSSVRGEDVLGSLREDEALRVTNDGARWIVDRAPGVSSLYRDERARLVSRLRALSGPVYQAVVGPLDDIYQLPESERDGEAEALLGTSRPKDPANFLLYSHLLTHEMLYGEVRLPALAIDQIRPDGSTQGTTRTLGDLAGYLAPAAVVQGVASPASGGRDEGALGALLFPSKESPEARQARLRETRCRLDTRWDPEDLRIAYLFQLNSEFWTIGGRRYDGRYTLPLISGSTLYDWKRRGIDAADVLTKEHAQRLEPRLRQTAKALRGSAVLNAPCDWKGGDQLLSDRVLEFAQAKGQSVLFPVPAFYNVRVEAPKDASLASVLSDALSPKTFSADAAANSERRLGVPRLVPSLAPPLRPRWIVNTVGGILTLSYDLRCTDDLAVAPLFDVSLANARLLGTPLTAERVLEAIDQSPLWKSPSNLSLPNEAVGWGRLPGLVPFARLMVRYPEIRALVKAAPPLSKTISLSDLPADARATLGQSFLRIDPYYVPGQVERSAQLVGGHLLNNPAKSFQIYVSKRNDKEIQFNLLFDGENVWTGFSSFP